MAKIDTSLWNNGRNLRARVKNLATMVWTLAVINSYVIIANKSWVVLGINILYVLTTIPVFLSWAKFQKLPPTEVNFDEKEKDGNK